MRLTQPQAVALAHWTPGVAAVASNRRGSPEVGTLRALILRRLLWPTEDAAYADEARLLLTPAGCSALATLVAAEVIIIPAGCVRLHGDSEDCGALCWTRSRCRVGMRGLEGGPSPTVIREALAWAPEVPS